MFCGRATWKLNLRNITMFSFKKRQKNAEYISLFTVFRWPFQLLRCPNKLKVMIVLLYLILFNVSHLFYVKSAELLWLVNGSSKKCYESLCCS